MNASWSARLDAKSEGSAKRILERFEALFGVSPLDVHLEEHHDGGYTANFDLSLDSERWSDAVYEAIELGERVGYGWRLAGSVLDSPEAHCTEIRIPGVLSASWLLAKS